MPSNSPTRRLLELLPRLADAVNNVGKDQPLYYAFSKLFRTEREDLFTHHRYYVRLLKLVEDARREVFLAYYDPEEPLDAQAATVRDAMSPLVPIRGALHHNSVHSKGAVFLQFPQTDLHLLHNSLKRFARSQRQPEDAVDRARQLIARANTVIGGAGLDPSLVAVFHEGTACVLQSLNQFESFGPDEAVEAVGQAIAVSISLEQHVPPAKQAAWREGLSLLADVIGVVQVAWPVLTPVLAQVATKLLGAG